MKIQEIASNYIDEMNKENDRHEKKIQEIKYDNRLSSAAIEEDLKKENAEYQIEKEFIRDEYIRKVDNEREKLLSDVDKIITEPFPSDFNSVLALLQYTKNAVGKQELEIYYNKYKNNYVARNILETIGRDTKKLGFWTIKGADVIETVNTECDTLKSLIFNDNIISVAIMLENGSEVYKLIEELKTGEKLNEIIEF